MAVAGAKSLYSDLALSSETREKPWVCPAFSRLDPGPAPRFSGALDVLE